MQAQPALQVSAVGLDRNSPIPSSAYLAAVRQLMHACLDGGVLDQCCPSNCLPGLISVRVSIAGSPRIDGSQARFPISKLKLDNLFLQWLSMAESQSLVLTTNFLRLALVVAHSVLKCNGVACTGALLA